MFKSIYFLLTFFGVTVSLNEVLSVQATLEEVNFGPEDGIICGENVLCRDRAKSANGVLDLTPPYTGTTRNLIYGTERISGQRRQDLYGGIGLATYTQSLQMTDISTHESASFSTSFQFEITPVHLEFNNGTHNDSSAERDYYDEVKLKDTGGDGLTFFLISDKTWIGAGGYNLGLFNPDPKNKTEIKVLAVEFDTFYSDPNDLHCNLKPNPKSKKFEMDNSYSGEIGLYLDVHNRTSTTAACPSDSGVESIVNRDGFGGIISVWIDYNGIKKNLEVRISRNLSKPTKAIIQHEVDLLQVGDETMWVGFSAANGNGVSTYRVSNWSFHSYGLTVGKQDSGSMSSSSGTPEKDLKAQESKLKLLAILGLSVGILSVFLLILFLVCLQQGKVRVTGRIVKCCFLADEGDFSESWSSSDQPRSFSYSELNEATNSFSPDFKVGEGAYGSLYRGVLPDGKFVCIKKLDEDLREGLNKLAVEAYTLMRIRHRNIAQLLGWCKHKHNLLLVCEYMPHDCSLDKALFSTESSRAPLSWSERHKVISGVAAALACLHEGWTEEVIHGDVNSNNVLLDEQNNAKLGGFGLASIVSPNTSQCMSAGFLAPEKAISKKINVKTDVYAFGAVALETASGRKALEVGPGPSKKHIVKFLRVWVEDCLCEGDLLKAADKRLNGAYDEFQVKVVLLLGLICTDPDPDARPVMHQVVGVLSGDFPMLSESTTLFTSSSSPELIKRPQIAFLSLLKSAKVAPHDSQPSLSKIYVTH